MKLPHIPHALILLCSLHLHHAQAADETTAPDTGLLTVQSPFSATETLQRIQNAITAKGLVIFTLIDHQAAARQAGHDMPTASVILFGNPALGTPMMQHTPTLAIDLPSKALIWENPNGQVFITLNTATYLGQRHKLPADTVTALQGLEKLVLSAVQLEP